MYSWPLSKLRFCFVFCDVRRCLTSIVIQTCRSSIRTGLSFPWRDDFSPSPLNTMSLFIYNSEVFFFLFISEEPMGINFLATGISYILEMGMQQSKVKDNIRSGPLFFNARRLSRSFSIVRTCLNQYIFGLVEAMDFQVFCDLFLCLLSFVNWKCRSSTRTGLSISWRDEISPSSSSTLSVWFRRRRFCKF